MKQTSTLKEFAKYTSFNVLAMIGLSCYILADTFFVSLGLGATGLAALNLAIPINSFISGTGLMLGMGGATRYSILKSQKNHKSANEVFTITVLISIFFSVLYVLAGLLFSSQITGLLGANDQVFEMCRTYLQVLLLFSPFFILNNVLVCFIRNDGAPGLSMVAMLSGSFTNIILDYIFIFPLNMGIFGAVLATGFAPIIGLCILSFYFIKKKNKFSFSRSRPSLKLSIMIFSCGIPSLITEISSGIVIIIFNLLIFNFEGNTGVAAYGIIANLSLVIIAIYTGIAQGVQPLMSRSSGVGDKTKIKTLLRYALALVASLSILIYTLIFFMADPIAGIFNSGNNMILQQIATAGMKIYFIGSIFAGLNIIFSIYFTATGHTRPAHIISILRGFLLIMPLSFLLSCAFGVTGLWSVFPVTEIVTAAISVFIYVCNRKPQKTLRTKS